MTGAAQQIEIRVNGVRKAVASGTSLVQLLESLGLRADRVAIEMNRQIVSRADWAATVVPEGAEIEIVQFVGGG